MDLPNRTLVLFAILTAALVALAVIVTFGVGQPPVEVQTGPPSVAIIPTVVRTGGTAVDPRGPLSVRRSSGRASTATLACDTFKSQRPFENGVAVFPSVPLGECSITLDGTEHEYEPVFPGDQLSCGPDGFTTECTGGLAASRAARVTVTSDLEGVVEVDGDQLGAIPVFGAPMKIGRREVRVIFPSGEATSWSLVVLPDQNIRVHFPDPYEDAMMGIPVAPVTNPSYGSTRPGPDPAPTGDVEPSQAAADADTSLPVPDQSRVPARSDEAPPPTGGLLAPGSP